ncbi:hypothetical protein ACQJBY_073153 [Aegilops geniculata]
MAEIVASAVVGETVTRVSSFIIDKPGKRPCGRDEMERLEMAHIKMEAALQLSDRWQITAAPVLLWRSKLKRAAQECDDTLRHLTQRQRAVVDEELRRQASSLPTRIAHAAKSLVSSLVSRGKDVGEPVPVRRFERFAEGAGEFVRFVELGGSPRQNLFFDPLIGHLLAGKTARYQALQGGRFYYLGIRPTSFAERGVEAMVGFVLQDFRAPAKSFSSRFMLRLSESSDVLGIIARCMQAVTPHLKAAAEGFTRELVQLPTQDFSWVESLPFRETEYWVDIHRTLTQCLRPDPLCCSGHDGFIVPSTCSSSKSDGQSSLSPSKSRLACTLFPEQVITVYLQCHISPPAQAPHKTHGGRRRSSLKNPGLKLSVVFIPHDFPEGIEPQDESFAFEVIDGEEQETVHRNATLQDVDEKLLPKAVDHLYRSSESRMYQLCLRSRHGTAQLCVEKTTPATRVPSKGDAAASRLQIKGSKRVVDRRREDYRIKGWQDASRDLLKLWVVRASDKLHGSLSSWTVKSPLQS